jgi:predicted GIY-YIG superfamily endonuclease
MKELSMLERNAIILEAMQQEDELWEAQRKEREELLEELENKDSE